VTLTHHDGCFVETGHHACAIRRTEELRADLASMEVERDAAVAVLRQVEWKDGGSTPRCPICRNRRAIRAVHVAGCIIAEAIGGAK